MRYPLLCCLPNDFSMAKTDIVTNSTPGLAICFIVQWTQFLIQFICGRLRLYGLNMKTNIICWSIIIASFIWMCLLDRAIEYEPNVITGPHQECYSNEQIKPRSILTREHWMSSTFHPTRTTGENRWRRDMSASAHSTKLSSELIAANWSWVARKVSWNCVLRMIRCKLGNSKNEKGEKHDGISSVSVSIASTNGTIIHVSISECKLQFRNSLSRTPIVRSRTAVTDNLFTVYWKC